MVNYSESRYLDEKIAIIKTELQNEINSIEWQIEQEEEKYRCVTGNLHTYRHELQLPNREGASGCFLIVAIVASIVLGFVLYNVIDDGSFFVTMLPILLPIAVFVLWLPINMIVSSLDRRDIQQRIAELDGKKQKMIDDAEAATDRRIDTLVEEYKNQVKEFGRLYHGNPISTAVARWLGTILIPKIEGASRADYYPHIKVSLAFSVEDNCVITEGERKYNLEDVGFVLDGSDYAPMGFAYAVSMHLKKLIAARFPKDPSGTPCNVTLRNTDAEATCTYDAINGNFV